MSSYRPGPRMLTTLVALALVVGAWSWWNDDSHTTIRAHFTSAEGLNVNDDVKVLGVSVGKIAAIENEGDDVVVTLEVDGDQPIPEGARAAIVAPSLVSGRFVQLAPVWTSGDRLEDGDAIGIERTAVPVTFDDVKAQLTDLATTLGPQKGEQGGALATTIVALEKSLRGGNSGLLRKAVIELHDAAAALSDGRSDLFSTVRNLDRFTRNLALNDAAVRGFTDELAAVGTVLADNRSTLRGALRDLADVLATTRKYARRHHTGLTSTVRDLNLLMAAVADRSNELAGIFHVGPHALIGLHNAIEDNGVMTRTSAAGFDSIGHLLCGALLGIGGTTQQCQNTLDPLFDLLERSPGGPS
ncbi:MULTISPECIES: MCE family protein [unclassified Nocardioides]|uniref:MCE family protein n=1 Tax=unclassified Nocardioides TaxID=2615069 RepID=UPI00138EE5BD|nr:MULTISPECIES: MCE family protein [unclassified Nocardioides]